MTLDNDTQQLLNLLFKLVVSLGIGVLIGLEREFSHRDQSKRTLAGIRTFALMSVFGFLSALLGAALSFWIPVVSMLGIFIISASGYWTLAREGRKGITTEVSIYITFLLGLLVYLNQTVFAVAVSLVVSIVLSLKPKTQVLVGQITEEEIYAIIKFLIVTVLVWPFLPNIAIDPYHVLNPREIWTVVVLVLSLSFVGYVLIKFWSTERGIMLTGFVGGLVSSTVVTWLFSKKSSVDQTNSKAYALATLSAISLMFARLLVLALLVNKQIGMQLLIPFVWLFACGAGTVGIIKRGTAPVSSSAAAMETLGNPFNLSDAVKFAALFCIILFLSSYANSRFGGAGVYAISALSGFANVDALVISMARLGEEQIDRQIALNAILVATITNNVVKLGLSWIWGSPVYKRTMTLGLEIIFLATILWAYLLGW